MVSDFWIAVSWWASLFLVGAVAYPFTKVLFGKKNEKHLLIWWDNGYLFSKAVGIVTVSYLVWILSSLRLLAFSFASIIFTLAMVFVLGLFLKVLTEKKISVDRSPTIDQGSDNSASIVNKGKKIILLEIFFLLAFLFWSFVKAHEPSIHGLEKYMDFGFTKSILNSLYMPPPDMWYAGGTINYYYFGHFVLAVLTKLSGIDLSFTFNLMLATLFAFTLTMSFSIGVQLLYISNVHLKAKNFMKSRINWLQIFLGGVLTSFLVTLAGNMQTIYAFTKGYTGDNVAPFWNLFWSIGEFWQKFPQGLEKYWYANATRFIPFTIHEFPSYSFVVSDIHGHVLSLPFVLLAIALLIKIFVSQKNNIKTQLSIYDWVIRGFFGLLVAVLFMTNALDGPIYFGLFMTLTMLLQRRYKTFSLSWMKDKAFQIAPVMIAGPLVFPFIFRFQTFVSGIAVNCPPSKLANSSIGVILFESVDKCQRSPFWMMWLLWGFFIFNGTALVISNIKNKKLNIKNPNKILNIFQKVGIELTQLEKVLLVFFAYSLILIIFPEFYYFRDIYPAHFRSNTMFKLGYQAFIMFSIISGYTIVKFIKLEVPTTTLRTRKSKKLVVFRYLFFIFLAPQLFLVSIFPIFSVRSYFNGLKEYKGLYGLNWLLEAYPNDYMAIGWLNKQKIEDRKQDMRRMECDDGGVPVSRVSCPVSLPIIVEADGDSYTDYARVSAFTGLPAIIGWPVHEWLWRGGYDVVAPRRDDVRLIYEHDNIEVIGGVLKKYQVSYIFVGDLERERYKIPDDSKFEALGDLVYQKGSTKIYKVGE